MSHKEGHITAALIEKAHPLDMVYTGLSINCIAYVLANHSREELADLLKKGLQPTTHP